MAKTPKHHRKEWTRQTKFVVKGSASLRMHICAEKSAHRQSAKRFSLP